MSELRKYQRWALHSFLHVFDQQTNIDQGIMINISEGGILLNSKKTFEVNKDYKFWMEAPLVDGRTERISFEVRAAWAKEIQDNNTYETGFELITSSSPEYFEELLKYVINQN
jgi:hypothetical protein